MSKSLTQNVHILLPEQEVTLLKRQSLEERKSVGELIRLAIRKVYGSTPPSERRRAFERLAGHNELKMDDWPKVKKELLNRYD